MTEYNKIRQAYHPEIIKYLSIAEKPPPSEGVASSRPFYQAEYDAAASKSYELL